MKDMGKEGMVMMNPSSKDKIKLNCEREVGRFEMVYKILG